MQAEAAHAFANNKRYVIERELGHGGMGVVYQALDLERNTRVALKALTQRDALNIYRLKNEFRQLADLSHPNLVALHELCNEGGAWFFTMELVNGQTFDDYVSAERFTSGGDPSHRVTSNGRFVREASITLSQRAIGSEFPMQQRVTCNVKRLRRVLRQLVEAVAALHDAGKLHRDLKPSNVLVTPEGRVVVLDFGLVSNSTFVDAEAQDAERTVGGCVFGTPAYMSPEQATGEAITTASDWYAVGTMLYEALTGQLPFDGTVLEILRQKESSEPLPVSEIVRGVPDDLDQLCRALLRRDPDKRPSSAEILRVITGHSEPPVIFDAQSSRALRQHGELFVGRERHVAELRAAFETAKSGKPVIVLVHGASGMGKSALVRCFANDLIRAEEAVVLRGRCYERETVPYKAFDNIIDALSRYLMRLQVEEAAQLLPRNIHALTVLFPVLKRVKPIAYSRRPKYQSTDARELRNQAFTALKELLLRITDHHPLVLNIDDLQWADTDSARLLSFLMGPPDPPPLLLIGTYRRDEADNSPFLKQMFDERKHADVATDLRDLAVDALAEAEAHHLASTLLADLPASSALFAGAIAAEADGVPFFITELVEHLRAHGERGQLPTTVQPISLEQVILERVAGMPPEAQRLLKVLSVAAGPIEQGVAIDAAGLPQGDRAAILALRAARLIRTRGTRQADKAETYHDRVRETVVHAMDPEAVRHAHARIAHAMERYDIVDPERMVEHYNGAGDGIRAGETAVQAAHTAAKKLAFNRAAELYKKGIELLSKSAPTRHALYEHLGDALANAGRGGQAAEAYLAAAVGAEPADARALQRRAAQQYLRSGRIEEGTALAADLFAQVGLAYPTTTARTLVTFAWNSTLLRAANYRYHAERKPASSTIASERLAVLDATFRELGVVDPLRGAALQVQFLRYALKVGDPEQAMHGLAWQAWTAAMTDGNPRTAHKILAEVDSMARRLDTPYAAATAKSAKAGCALLFGRVGEVLTPATEAEQTFRDSCAGTQWEQNLAATYRYAAIEHTGGFATILKEAPDRARDALEKGDRFSAAFLTLFVGFSHLVLDKPQDARAFLLAQREHLSTEYSTFNLWIAMRTTHALLYVNDGRSALQYMEGEMRSFNASACARGRFFATTMKYLLARACLMAARRDAADRRSLLARAEQNAVAIRKTQQPHAGALASLLLAEVAWKSERIPLAIQHLRSCIDDHAAHQASMFVTYAERSLGRLLGGDEGRKLIQTADDRLRGEGILSPERWSRIWVGDDD